MALTCCRAAAATRRRRWNTVGALARTAAKAFDVRPLAAALEKTLKSPTPNAGAFFVRGPGAHRRAGGTGRGHSPFAALLRRRAPQQRPLRRNSHADLGAAEQALMDRRAGGVTVRADAPSGETPPSCAGNNRRAITE